MNKKKRILFIASGTDTGKDLFPISRYEIIRVNSAAIARQKLFSESFDLVFIINPLPDESAIRMACETAAVYKCPVLLVVPSDTFDQATYQCMDQMVFVICSPINKNLASQAISLLEKTSSEIRRLERQIQKEKQKLKDEKMIALCKMKLVEHYHWSEEKAHSFIGKKAMDHSTTRVNIARVLLNKLQA